MKKAKKWGIGLYMCLLVCVCAMIYFEVNEYPLLYELVLLGVMFVISMCLLWCSEKEDEETKKEATGEVRMVKIWE
jgi:hypothetical protein